jgi:hypothetical protein
MCHAKTWDRTPRRFNRSSFLVAAVATGCLLTAPRLSSQAAQNPKAQQGIDLIKQILAKDGRYTRTTKSGNSQYKSVTERKFAVSAVKGCLVDVVSESHLHTEMSAQNREADRKSTDTFHVDFSALDPSSVVVSDPPPPQPGWETTGYLVRIKAEADKPPIRASTRDQQTNEEHDLPSLPNLALYVTSRDQADRLAKAFAQVATACHSQPAP